MPDEQTKLEESPSEIRRDRMTFYPVVLVATVFCVSIFIVIAATFGDQNNPANQWVNRYANIILIVETVVLLVVIFGAMALDRIRTLNRIADDHAANEGDSQSTAEETERVD